MCRSPTSLTPSGWRAALLLAIALGGCGGGGSGDDTPPPPAVNQAPTASISASTTDGYAALTVTFDGSASRDPDGSIARYDWDFGDGAVAGSGIRVSHTFTDPGGYNVRLTVTDDDGAAGAVLQNVRVRGTTLSGSVRILSTSAVDSDVNDQFARPVANDDRFTAQLVANPVRIGGFVNLPGTGDPDGNLYDTGDPADFYAIRLTGNELVLLNIADPDADLDLRLWDAAGALVDASLTTDATESIAAPAPGDYFLEVFPYDGPSNPAGASNYVLSVGQTLAATARPAGRLADPFVPDELILAAGVGADLGATRRRYALQERGRAGRFARATLGPETLNRLRTRDDRPVALPAGLSSAMQARYRTLLVLKALQRDAAVAHAELNVLMQATLEPDDGLYDLQWHLREIGLPAAWDITTGAPTGPGDVIVAVVDTGILPNHPDLAAQLTDDGYDFIADAGRARDFNGIDDDPTDPGDLAFGGSSSFHGTHVAGTAAARTDNGQGVAGVSWFAKLMPLRVLGVDGGTTYDVMQAVRYAAGLANDSGRLPDRPADIINLSLASPFFSASAQDTFDAVRSRGVLIVASAGNESSTSPSYPAAYNGVISVSATTIDGSLAPYSNRGASIDVAAPGGYNATDHNGDGFGDGVLSTLGDDSNGAITLGYGALNGTSMSAPHVAGVAALMKAVHSGLTPAQFDAALAAGDLTDDLGPPGRDDDYGFGQINAQKAVLAALALAGGAGSDPGPVLGTSLSAVDLGVLASSQTVRLSNLGTGPLQIGQTIASAPWLGIVYVESPPAADGLGDYDLQVDRSGLTEGAWNASARFVPTDPAVNPVTVTVTLQVAGASPDADAGLFYVIAVNEDGSNAGVDVVSAENGEYHWTMTDLPAGSYRVFGGSDMDNDNYLCDAGESCGAYRTLDAQERISVDPSSIPEVTGLDFVAEFRAVISSAAGGSASEQR